MRLARSPVRGKIYWTSKQWDATCHLSYGGGGQIKTSSCEYTEEVRASSSIALREREEMRVTEVTPFGVVG